MNLPLDKKHVAFVGTFDHGSLELKDIVFEAGGIPTDNIPDHTNYLVVGGGGERTQMYKKCESMRESGKLIELTPDELRDICAGKTQAPVPVIKNKPKVTVYSTKESIKNSKELEDSVFQDKREAYLRRYGLRQPDGSRVKMDLRFERILDEILKKFEKE